MAAPELDVPPNLLFLFADEMRGSAMGCAGNPDVRTPALDRLAAEGVRFTHALANNAVCTPGRGSLLTGCWPHTHRAVANDLPVDPEAPAIARALAAAGYRCGYIGKWHLGGMPRDRFIPPGPERLGFDDFWAAWNCHHQYLRPKYHVNDDPTPVLLEGVYEPVVQTDLAMDWIGRRTAGETAPWALYVSYGPPHEPYRPLPPGYEGRYDPRTLHLPPTCPDTPAHRQDLADYYTHVTALDDQLGRLLSFLDARGELDETLIVWTSDHGSMLGSHGRQNKHSPWEEATVVPFLLRYGPHLPAGRVDDLMVSQVDVAPTLLGLLGLTPDSRMAGLDLSRQVRGRGGERPRSALLQAVVCADQAAKDGLLEWRGVRTHTATYAMDLNGPWLLFDNAGDPSQQRNLVDQPASEALRTDLQAELRRWLARIGDTLLPRDAYLASQGLTRLWEARLAHNRALRQRIPGG